MSVENVKATFLGSQEPLDKISDSLFQGERIAPDVLNTAEYEIQVKAVDDAGNESIYEKPITVTVAPRWITPKIDWAAYYDVNGNYIGDFFNIEDWRRIIGNLEYLKELALKMYPIFPWLKSDHLKDYSDLPYAFEWNTIEVNINALIYNTYPLKQMTSREYFDEMSFVNYNDLNRIESTCLAYYTMLHSQWEGLKTLAFTLGGDEFGD